MIKMDPASEVSKRREKKGFKSVKINLLIRYGVLRFGRGRWEV